MTFDELLAYFWDPNNRREYIKTIPDGEKEWDVYLNYLSTLNVEKKVNAEREKIFGDSGKEVRDMFEDVCNEKVPLKQVLFIGMDGSIEPLSKFNRNPRNAQEDIDIQLKNGKLCMYWKPDDNEVHLVHMNTMQMKMAFYGGKELTIDDVPGTWKEVPNEERVKFLHDNYKLEMKDAEKLLNSSREDVEKLSRVAKFVGELKEGIDALWDIVHDASLWWRNSGNYTNMHNSLKKINEYLQKKGENESIVGDFELGTMLSELMESTNAYLNSKDPDNLNSENARNRYDAAKQVKDTLGLYEWNLQLMNEKSAIEKTADAKGRIHEIQQASQFSDIGKLLEKLKRDGIVPKKMQERQLMLAIIANTPTDKTSFDFKDETSNMRYLLEDLWTGQVVGDSRDRLEAYVEEFISADQEPDYEAVSFEQLQAFYDIVNKSKNAACRRMGGSILAGLNLSPEQIKTMPQENNVNETNEEVSKKIKNACIQNEIIKQESDFINSVSKMNFTAGKEGIMIPKEDVKTVIAAELIKQNSGEEKRQHKNTSYYFVKQTKEQFIKDIYEVVKPWVKDEDISLKDKQVSDMVNYDKLIKVVNEHKEEMVNAMEAFCTKKIQTLKAHVTEETQKKTEAKQQQKEANPQKDKAPKKEASGRAL